MLGNSRGEAGPQDAGRTLPYGLPSTQTDQMNANWAHLALSTTGSLTGLQIDRYWLVYGYAESFHRALDQLKKTAVGYGAHAVVDIRVDSHHDGHDSRYVVYGTAVTYVQNNRPAT